MGCNSSKAFKEKESGSAITAQSPTIVDTRRTSEEPLSPHKEKSHSLTPVEESSPEETTPANKEYGSDSSSPREGRGQAYSPLSPSTYSAPVMTSATNPAYLSPPVIDYGYSGSGAYSGGGGYGRESGCGGGSGASST
ncbi:hypothetical protein FRC11_005236, partial [Ceratobasidium sp. 423]